MPTFLRVICPAHVPLAEYVAVPLGSEESVESQISGSDELGGLQVSHGIDPLVDLT